MSNTYSMPEQVQQQVNNVNNESCYFGVTVMMDEGLLDAFLLHNADFQTVCSLLCIFAFFSPVERRANGLQPASVLPITATVAFQEI